MKHLADACLWREFGLGREGLLAVLGLSSCCLELFKPVEGPEHAEYGIRETWLLVGKDISCMHHLVPRLGVMGQGAHMQFGSGGGSI